VTLPALPSIGTPIAPLSGGGPPVLFAADQSGNVTAVRVDNGDAYWPASAALAGESFTAGVSGVLSSYAAAAFRTSYAGADVLFLGSATTGKVYALDAATGGVLWSFPTGSTVRASIYYDPGTNWIYVPTDGAGILAYDLGTSSRTIAPSAAAIWSNPHPTGHYTLGCTTADVATDMACADSSGSVRVLGRATGAVTAGPFSSGASPPTTLWGLAGSPGGLLVSSASKVVKLARSGSTLSVAGTPYAPAGVTLSPVQVFGSSGLAYVGESSTSTSSLVLRKLNLADLSVAGSSSVPARAAGTLPGPSAFDVTATKETFFFGSGDGRLWAVPSF
jgi:hypothetical protein